jgi:hypothetical protein
MMNWACPRVAEEYPVANAGGGALGQLVLERVSRNMAVCGRGVPRAGPSADRGLSRYPSRGKAGGIRAQPVRGGCVYCGKGGTEVKPFGSDPSQSRLGGEKYLPLLLINVQEILH